MKITVIIDGQEKEIELSDEQREAIKNAEILMIDGNEMDAAEEACKIAKNSDFIKKHIPASILNIYCK